MLEVAAHEALLGMKDAGIDFVSGLPDGWQRNLHELVEDDPDFRYVPVCNEGVGFSVCAGAWLGGRKTALIMENSGLRVASEYIARISLGCGVPVVLLLSYRGDLGETEHWGIPHGIVVEPLLDALRIPYAVVRHADELRRAVMRAHRIAEAQLHPAAVLVSGDCVWEDWMAVERYDWLERLAAAPRRRARDGDVHRCGVLRVGDHHGRAPPHRRTSARWATSSVSPSDWRWRSRTAGWCASTVTAPC